MFRCLFSLTCVRFVIHQSSLCLLRGKKKNNKNRLFNHYNAIPGKMKQNKQKQKSASISIEYVFRIILAQDSQALI